MDRNALLESIHRNVKAAGAVRVTSKVVSRAYRAAPEPFSALFGPLHSGHAGFERDMRRAGYDVRFEPASETYLVEQVCSSTGEE